MLRVGDGILATRIRILQRTCKPAGLLELLHSHVEAPTLDVQVPVGRGQVGVTEESADEVHRHASLVKATASFVPEISQLEIRQASPLAGPSPRPAHALDPSANRVPEYVRVSPKRCT
jgi:hypothetical protein